MKTSRMLTYALNAENKLVNVNDVPNGLECNCKCPGCKEPLIAKNDGKKRIHHFAHASDAECVHGYQTMIHLLAKEIIRETRLIPKYNCIALDVKTEVRLNGLNIIPDVLVFTEFKLDINYYNRYIKTNTYQVPIIIEIFVTHKVDEKKAEIIKKADIAAMEIDLSKTEATTKEELFNDIYNKPENITVINKPFWEKNRQIKNVKPYKRNPHNVKLT